MPGACLNSWQTNCEWTVGYVWRSLDWVERAIYIALALMLAYTCVVVLRFFTRYRQACRDLRNFESKSKTDSDRSGRSIVASLNRGMGTLKAIASSAPLLGLAGTCYGLLAIFFIGFGVEKSAVELILMTNAAATLLNTGSGILVAIVATFSYNLLQTRIEALCGRVLFRRLSDSTQFGSLHFAQTLLLKKRFSSLPHFSAMAATAIACVVALFLAFEPYVRPTGLSVALRSPTCGYGPQGSARDRPVFLRINNSGKLFINMEPEDWKGLRTLFDKIYRSRETRELFVYAEDDVSFQTVADAIDIARNSPAPGPDSLDIKVILVTPNAARECFAPVRTTQRHRLSDESTFPLHSLPPCASLISALAVLPPHFRLQA